MKYNKRVKGTTKTINFEGASSYLMDERLELYTRVLNSLMGENKFYQSGKDSDDQLIKLTQKLSKDDPKFVAGLASIARNKFYLRSVPQVLTVELSRMHKGDNLVSKIMQQTIQRPDDMTELLAYYGRYYGKVPKKLAGLPKQIKLGLSKVFPKFNDYQLAKYNRKSEVTLKDVLFLSHAKPINKEQERIWKQLIDGTLPPPETWEVKLSEAGQKGLSKKEVWESIIPKMGYMAILRNLRNFVKEKVSTDSYLPVLTNIEKIRKSKQFPFRFMSAYRELSKPSESVWYDDYKDDNSIIAPSKVLDGIIEAMEISVNNIPEMKGITLIACDNSGSMTDRISARSKVTRQDIANLMGAIINSKYPDAMAGVFGADWKIVPLSRKNPILTNKEKLGNTDVGHATNTWKIFDWLARTKTPVDRIIIFSDEQTWDSGWGNHEVEQCYKEYKQTTGYNPCVYSIDLAGYGTSALDPRNPKLRKLAGWSDKIFDYIIASEEDPKIIFDDIYNAV